VQLDATIRTESTLIVLCIMELDVLLDEVELDVVALEPEVFAFSSPVISTS
jgi:hypothetical protein